MLDVTPEVPDGPFNYLSVSEGNANFRTLVARGPPRRLPTEPPFGWSNQKGPLQLPLPVVVRIESAPVV